MSCITNGVTIIGDKNNRLSDSVAYVSKTDTIKAQLLAGYINTPEFRQFLKKNIDIEEPLDIHQNVFRKLLNLYYNAKNLSVNNSINRKMADSIGNFTNAIAQSVAKDHTANIIIGNYYEKLNKPKIDRKSNIDIINNTIRQINSNFINNIALPLVKDTIDNNKNKFAKDLAQKAKEYHDLFNNIADNYDNLLNELDNITDEIKINEINSKLDSLDEELNELGIKRYISFFNLVQEAGNDRQKNYTNLVAKTRGDKNKWFNEVFTISKLVNIVNDFEQILKSDKLDSPISIDDNDIINPDNDSINEMSKSWENNDNKDFSQYVSTDIKLYFNRLYKLATPTKDENGKYNYDSNNELGVPMTMNANYIIAQISNYANFSSTDDFIKSIEDKAIKIPSLYGLIQMVDDMKKDRNLANKIFTQLSHPKINKVIAIISDNNDIDFKQSNNSIEPISHMLFSLINQTKFTMTNSFDINDAKDIQNLIIKINKERSNELFNNSFIRKESDNKIIELVNKYFPKLNKNDITNYLYSDHIDSKVAYINILQNFNSFVQNVEITINNSNKARENYNIEYVKWKQGVINEKPIYSIDYDKLNPPLIELSKLLINYVPVKNELNSINAEGNLSSDIVDNNYISNIIKQINFGTQKDTNDGLNKLKEFITRGSQYNYSTIFYGIKDNKGNTLVPGLFERTETGDVIVNPNAKDIIKIAMFNGAKDNNNTKSTLYAGMSKGDYFLTTLIAFNQPINYIKQTTGNFNTAGFFMRTPSDAPKNYIVQMPKYSYDNFWDIDNVSKNNYINDVVEKLNIKLNPTNIGEYADLEDELVLNAKDNNFVTASELYNIISNSIIENRNYNNTYNKYDKNTNKVLIPLIYKNQEQNIVTVWIEGNKVIGTSNNIIENVIIKSVYSVSGNKLPKGFINNIQDSIVSEGITNNNIIRDANPNNQIFKAIYTNLYGELNNFIENLNNVFSKDNKGNWKIKKDINGLIDRYHINNGTIIDKDGKLTGNVFKFIRLFNNNDIDYNDMIGKSLSLYRETNNIESEPLFIHTKNNKLVLNTNRQDIITINDNRIALNISKENKLILEDIVKDWIKSFSSEITKRTIQYNTILNNRFTNSQIEECIFNNAIIEMQFDDLFEGDTKFYKSSQDFLKRAKEVQAGGNAYGNQNIADYIGTKLINIVDNNGSEIPIIINGKQYEAPYRDTKGIKIKPMVARNGFRAVTIFNTVRPSDNAKSINDELFYILKDKIGDTDAKKIAKQISDGYFDKTKTNDAQSYITLEEFISRKQADGSISEYESIFEQLLDDTPIQDIDISNINAKIQVQKNFYFDKQFDSTTKTYYPRQIKNAEFVLIPKLLPKNSSLMELYNIMRRNDIGQINTVEASKAAKKNILTFWDNNGNVNADFEKDINGIGENIDSSGYNDSNVENYYYRFLYKQQDVPEHMKDEYNKAGIQIMKKIIDNSNTANDKVRGHVNDFFEAYVANIKEDFNILLDKMGWSLDNGQLKNKNGNNTTNLDFTEFYRKARIEAQRLGMDSNFIQYLTPDNLGVPAMPNYMNNVSSKLESIAQAIFNSAITRQKLPGWHAAQITNVGYDKKLKFHPEIKNEDGSIKHEAYAEVLLPRWSNIIPKDYDINKLADEQLDIHLGYRIPTEGKQSISILKVVGFLDDVYGSTIVVPDEWVTQTGSDFDVDSVYGISYELYKTKDKENNVIIKKITADYDDSINGIRNRYVKYVNNNLKQRIAKDIIPDDFIKNNITELYNSIVSPEMKLKDSKTFNDLLKQENELYNKLPIDVKNIIKSINKEKYEDSFASRIETIAAAVESYGAEISNTEDKQLCYEFADIQDAIVNLINYGQDRYESAIIEFKSAKKDIIKSIYEKSKEDYFNKVEDVAKKSNIESYKEFSKRSIIEQQNRRARNNIILDSMVAIMNDSSSREENYSRSNFDDLTISMKKMNELSGKTKLIRSSYNLLDQIDFMENAMSGAQLKAFSVARDTFNSVNNYIKSELNNGHVIPIKYDLAKYDIKTLKDAYGENVIEHKEDNTAIIYHKRFAWSINNRNVIGKLITPYSSQTTAHILDAIKEGTIFNENQYTFGTFKTLVDLGTDYDTAVAFIMQPGITEIVTAYSETKSIYINSTVEPIRKAIKSIASKLGITIYGKPIDIYTSYENIIQTLDNDIKLKTAFKELFSADISIYNSVMNQVFVLDNTMLQKRLSDTEIYNNSTLSYIDKQYRDAAFDLAMISTFNKIHNTTINIEKIVRCSNPDKFGAKQTIRATRKIKSNIIEYAKNDDNNVIGKTLLVNNEPILNSLYPNIENNNIDIEKSSYKYLAAFLNYATLPSIEANSKLFATESETYNTIINHVENVIGKELTDDQYKEYKQYMISNVYNGVPFLTTPLTINDYGYIGIDENAIKEQTERNTFYWNEERARIFGYDKTETDNIYIKDINNPTIEEINEFNKFTPAQKVIWIQQNFTDGKGIFEVLDVNGFNQQEYKNKGFSSSTIKYSDQIDNIEELFLAFRESYFNKNPLIRLSAIDLIKYAFVVEGFKFKKGGISKIITNDSMLSNIEDKGLNIISAIDRSFNSYSNPYETATHKFIEKYIRSHSDIIKEINIPKSIKNNQGNGNIGFIFDSYIQSEDMIYIPYTESSKNIIEYLSFDSETPRDYIRINRINKTTNKRYTTLYRIERSDVGVYFIPLNLLERNEVSDYSVNKNNNIYKGVDYYEAVVSYANEQHSSINEIRKNDDAWKQFDELRKSQTIVPHKNTKLIETLYNANELQRLSVHGSLYQKAEVTKFIKDISDYISSPVEGQLSSIIIRNDGKSISNIIPKNISVIQNISIGETNRMVRIEQIEPSKNFKWLIKGDQRGDINKISPIELQALQNTIEAKSIYPILYKITPLTDDNAIDNDNKSFAITSIIDDTIINNIFEPNDSDNVAKAIANEIISRSKREHSNISDRFKKVLNLKGIDIGNYESIHDNKRNIYTAAATYYAIKSRELLNDINGLVVSNGESFSINDTKLYEYLRDNREDFNKVSKTILDAKTFGNQFYDIFNLNIESEDAETSKAIESIRNDINRVRNNEKLAKGVELIFNDYIANTYATNPLIRNGLIELRTQFGDTDWFDLNTSDVGELNNKQVQTIVKSVYNIINTAKLKAKESSDEFAKSWDKIVNRQGDFNINNVITKDGKIVRPYTDKFIEDKEDIRTKVYEAEIKYGTNSIEYLKAKLNRDEWRAKNLQQEVVSTYYNELNKLTRNVLNNAPKEYSEYKQLVDELYGDNRPIYLLTEDEKERRKQLKYAIKDLLSDMNGDSLKIDESRYRISQLRNFIKAKKLLNSEYFKTEEVEGFSTILNNYLNYIDNYKNNNPYKTLDQNLLDDKFKEAYDWVQANSIYKISDDANNKLNDAFKLLSDRDNISSKEIKTLLKEANAIDVYGNVDARKLNSTQIQIVKNLTMSKYSKDYDSNAGESILIKDIPTGLPVFKSQFYRSLRGDGETEQNPRRLQIIHEINDIIIKGVDKSGRIKTTLLFNNLNEEELNKLINLYKELNTIKSKRSKESRNAFKNAVEFKSNKESFIEEWLIAQRELNKEQYQVWLNIFVQIGKDGTIQTDENGSLIPNDNIYGYIIPKDKSMIDEDKTKARNIIENSIEYVPNEYYYAASREATKNDTFNEWYKDNHIFNPFTHKFEPLKIWTTMRVVPGGELNAEYEYIPTNDNLERNVKDEYKNAEYKPYTTNYNIETGDYNNRTNLTKKEKDMVDYLQSIINSNSITHSMRSFAEKGFIPRRSKFQPDNKWYASQVIGSLGLEFRHTGENKWSEQIDYTHDFDADFDMTTLLKGKGYQELQSIPVRGTLQSPEEYEIYVNDIKTKNKEIETANLALDNELMDRDYKSVFMDFISKAVIFDSKQKAKNSIYLLLEDLKDNKVYNPSRYSGNLKIDNKMSTANQTVYQKVEQNNTYSIVENWAKRIIFNEFKKDSKYGKWADLAQNITSAKYMIFNVTGGIANVFTGLSNVYGEIFAKDYFDQDTWRKAQAQYFSNSLSMLSDMYNPITKNLSVAITKLFNVVDFDAFTERRPNENATEYIKRVRDGLYALQSGGEHYMQNAVLFACLKSHRIFEDFDGVVRAGSISNYNWKLEHNTLVDIISGDENLRLKYKSFIIGIKNDLNELRKYDSFSKDFNEEFLRDIGDKKLINKYITARNKALKNAKTEFKTFSTVESQFELSNGVAQIKKDSKLTKDMFAELQQKVISINKKIHGVYDKEGAARIEREWWGGLVMQYHKHIYPGIMKRYRNRGYYNEMRSSIEKGSYVSLTNFLSTEFKGIGSKIKEQSKADNQNIAITSIQSVIKAAIDTIINFRMNYRLMPEWERNNVRRTLGDLLGVASAFLMAIGIHIITDDDELKESDTLATVLYLADRLNSESSMYTPWGLRSEASTLWSSPIAAVNGPGDLLKGLSIGANYLFDEDYNINYTTGLYKEENKAWVLFRRNIPMYRVYDRLNHMSRNNQYYRINDNAMNIKTAKNIADSINPD